MNSKKSNGIHKNNFFLKLFDDFFLIMDLFIYQKYFCSWQSWEFKIKYTVYLAKYITEVALSKYFN